VVAEERGSLAANYGQQSVQGSMVRVMAVAAMAGALVGAVALYALTRFDWRGRATEWFVPSSRTAEVSLEPWPICTTMGSIGDSADWAQLDPDFVAGKKALGAGDWHGAIAAFTLAALRDPQNADIQNYVGYAYRRLRQLQPAFAHYRQALALNPRHRSAHEHLGEAYLVKGDLDNAEKHLAKLESICLVPCAEYGDLQTAIAVYKSSATR
jgi:tetratricopeptide (TPR) repeat protein